jgi:hypothetical protein
MAMVLISARMLNPFWTLSSSLKWDKGMDINPEGETFYIGQYKKGSVKHVKNENYAKHQRVPVNKPKKIQSHNLVSSTMVSECRQSSFDPYDLSSDDEEELPLNNGVQMTPRRSDCAARLSTAAWLYLNSPPELPKNWGQINPNLNNHHSDPEEISSTFWIPNITDWRRNEKETNSKYPYLSTAAFDIFSLIQHGVGVECILSLGRDVCSGRQSTTTGETICEKVIVRQFT